MSDQWPIVWVRYGRGWTQAQEIDRAGKLAVRVWCHGRIRWYATANVLAAKPETQKDKNEKAMLARYGWLIEAWNKGYRSERAIFKMKNCQCASCWGIFQMLRTAKRRGWIKE